MAIYNLWTVDMPVFSPGRPGGRSAVVRGSFCGSSAAPNKNSFDRGGPVWPPRSNAADDRLGEGTHPTMTLSPPPLPDQRAGRGPLTKNMT